MYFFSAPSDFSSHPHVQRPQYHLRDYSSLKNNRFGDAHNIAVMADDNRQWGIYGCLSNALPTPEQLSQNEALIEELKHRNNFESSDATGKRVAVLKKFHKMTVELVKEVGRQKGLSDAQLRDAGGTISPFGSYKLGVFGPGSDIDTLIVAPKHVSRDDWFEQFPPLMDKMSDAGAIEEMKPVRDAHVPIIKLKYSGIDIDMIFTRLQLSSVPYNLDLTDINLLRDLDALDSRCLNGAQVSSLILGLVPQEATFRHALRAIKLWAQRRAIYANIVGFPGGIAWAIMTACVCQMYPKACGSVLVGKFFHLMRTWPWPRPIQLKHFAVPPSGVSHRVWNIVASHSDAAHIMPVITPAYPEMCSTHNQTKSNHKIILRELQRGEEITKVIYTGAKKWADLFEKHTFFTKDFRYYLSLVAGSKTKEAQLVWSGLVESKLRRLVASIDVQQPNISIARPFNKGFDRIHQCKGTVEIGNALHGRMDHVIKDSKSVKEEMANDATHMAAAAGDAENGNLEMPQSNGEATNNSSGVATIYTTTYYIGLELKKDAKSLDVSHAVTDFTNQCESWPQYKADLNSIKVVSTKS